MSNKYQLAYKIFIVFGLVVLLDNALYVAFGWNIIPTIFLYTIGLLGSLDLLNLAVYLWSRSYILWFTLALILRFTILKKNKSIE